MRGIERLESSHSSVQAGSEARPGSFTEAEGSDTHKTIRLALSGRPQSRRELVEFMLPVIQQRVVRIVLRYRQQARGRSLRQEVEDLTQDVLLHCFKQNGKVLKDWTPKRGLSLRNFVGLVTERLVLSILRSRRRSPWSEEPVSEEELDVQTATRGLQQRVEALSTLQELSDRLQERISPLGMQMFRWLFVEQQSIGQVAQRAGTSPAALYAWRTRLARIIRSIRSEIEAEVQSHG